MSVLQSATLEYYRKILSRKNKMNGAKIQEIADEAGVSAIKVLQIAKELSYKVRSTNSIIPYELAEELFNYIINNKNKSDQINISKQTRISIDKIKIKIKINNLKSIKAFEWEFDLKKGVMAIIGANGIGKSSFIVTLAKLVHPSVFKNELIGNGYKNTRIEYLFDDSEGFIWIKPNYWKEENNKNMPKINGYFESSILGGKMFRIYNNLKNIEVDVDKDTIELASAFIRENMNYIMYGKNSEEERFKTLYKVNGVRKRKKHSSNIYESQNYIWYTLKIDDAYIHEYYFSTGEYFLLSLLKFIEILVLKRNNKTSMIIIDEIELSLHALAQKRLVEKLREFTEEYNIMVVFSTHSLQIIEKMNPENIFLFQNKEGNCSISSPCYPGYLTSRLETHKYYDRIILVEDYLAEFFILEAIKEENINDVLYKVIAIGGWEKVLETYLLNESQKFYGDAKTLVVLDGDVKSNSKVNSGRKSSVKKTFLPLDNVEKSVVEMIINKDEKFKKFIEKLILPKMFDELNFYFNEDILSKTDKIKNGYHHFIKAVLKETSYISYNELEKNIIVYILKENNHMESYKEFSENIVNFLNN